MYAIEVNSENCHLSVAARNQSQRDSISIESLCMGTQKKICKLFKTYGGECLVDKSEEVA